MRKNLALECVYERLLSSGNKIKESDRVTFVTKVIKQVYEPTVFENYIQDVVVDGKTIELSIWDTAGNAINLDNIKHIVSLTTKVFIYQVKKNSIV